MDEKKDQLTVDIDVTHMGKAYDILQAKFGCKITQDGLIRCISDNTKLGKFENKEKYNEFANTVTRCIWNLLQYEKGYNMKSFDSPFPNKSMQKLIENNKSNGKDTKKQDLNVNLVCKAQFLVSDNCFDKKVLLLIIPGAGLRAGIWSRSLMVNDGLAFGTMLPFIDLGLQRNYGIILLDPNGPHPKYSNLINYNHCLDVWESFISNKITNKSSKTEHVLVIAHSAGGYAWSSAMNKEIERRKGNMNDKRCMIHYLRGIAGTDAMFDKLDMNIYDYFYKYNLICNWTATGSTGIAKRLKVESKVSIDESKQEPNVKLLEISAGTSEHPRTSPNSCVAIFQWFDDIIKQIESNGLFYTYQSKQKHKNDNSSGKSDTQSKESGNCALM